MYEIQTNKNGEYYFVLKASNGIIIITSENYASLSGCYNGIDTVKKYANSQIRDLTIPVRLKK